MWVSLPVFLVAGAWASSQLGLHALLGAYFGGAMVPPAWGRRLPVERLGQFALIGLAPLFFGHSGLKIDGSVLGWASLQASLVLLVLAVGAKLVAVLLCPPSSTLSRRDALAVGALAMFAAAGSTAAGAADKPQIDTGDTAWLLVATLGIMQAGAAYVPLDLQVPAERLQFILQESQAAALVTHSELAAATTALAIPRVLMDHVVPHRLVVRDSVAVPPMRR